MAFFVSERRKAHYRAAWIGLTCVLSAACSVYDPTLLEARRDAIENGGTAGAELGANGGQADASGGMGALGGTDAAGGTSGNVAGDTGSGGSGGVSGSAGASGMSGGSGGAAGRGGSAGTSAGGAGQSGSGGSSGCSGDCQVLKSALKHRYSFNGTGTTITDSVGKAPGKAVNATLSGSGTLKLAGGTSDTYVDLPNGIISSLTDATFEVWLTWNGGDPWQRIFDFGNSVQGEDTQSGGVSYFFLAASSAWGPHLRTAYSLSGIPGESAVQSSSSLPVGSTEHVTVIFDDTHNQVSLYIDGAFNTGVGLDAHLSALQDVNNWLGRSQFADPALSATLDEFRIYGAALTADQILLSHKSGPNPSFLP
jgi:hypothetical protein